MVRPLQFGIVATVPGRVRGDEAAVLAADWAETLLIPDFFVGAPFKSVSLIVLYSDETDLKAEFQRRRGDELPVTVALSIDKLKVIKRDELQNVFRFVILGVLLAVAMKFGLPQQQLRSEMQRLPVPVL